MTMPAFTPTQGVLAAGSTPADGISDPNHFAARMGLIESSGNSWIDPQIQANLAGSTMDDQTMVAVGHSYAGSLLTQAQQAGGSLLHAAQSVFEDPVLYKKPSTSLWLHQFFTGQMSWQPVADLNLPDIQTSLQKYGFGQDLPANGVWTTAWQEQFHQATDKKRQEQQGNEGGRGFSFFGALHGVLSAFMPSHAIPALWGTVKALPGDVRNIAADIASGVTDVPHEITSGDPLSAIDTALNPLNTAIRGSNQSQGHRAATLGATIESFGGPNMTAEQFNAAHGWHRSIENINTLLTLFPMFKTGSVAFETGGQALKQGLLQDLGRGSVLRGPGMISNLIYRPAGYYADEAGTTFVRQGGLLGSKVFDNMPWLKQAIPPVRSAVEGGQRYYYYTVRPAFSSAYRLPIVRAAGATTQNVLYTGALLRGDANLVNKIEGGNSPFADQVLAEKAWTGPVGFAADLIGSMAHGPLTNRLLLPAKTAADAQTNFAATHLPVIGVNPSQTLGDAARAAERLHEAMLSDPGVIGAFERGTGLKYDQLVDAHVTAGLSKEDVDWTLRSKVDELAAADWANAQPQIRGLTGAERERVFRDLSAQARTESVASQQARAAFLDNDAHMAVRFAQDTNSILSASDREKSLGMVARAQARREAYALFNEHPQELVGPHTWAALSEAEKQHAFDTAMGDSSVKPNTSLAWLGANNPRIPHTSYGIARAGTHLQPDALHQATVFEQRLTDAGYAPAGIAAEDVGRIPNPDPAAIAAIRKDMNDYLLNELGADPRTVPADATGMVAMIRDKANHLAAPLNKPLDPSPDFLTKWDALHATGYKPVVGTNIGFEFAPPVTDPVLIDGRLSVRRKIVETLGAGDTKTESMDAAAMHKILTLRKWQQRANDGQINLPPGYTADLMWKHAIDNMPSAGRLTGVEGAMFKLRENRWRQIARSTFAAGSNPTEEDIDTRLTALEAQLAGQKSLLDLSAPKFFAAITKPPENPLINEMRGVEDTAPLIDKNHARLMYLDMVNALNHRPMWMFGLGKLEDVARAGFSFAGRPAASNRAFTRVATAGNDLIRARNRVRFSIDPMFSARRVTKSAVKLSLRGVPFSVTPLHSMIQQGTLDDDLALANRLIPEKKGIAEGFDAMDRTLYDGDLFGVFNPRHFVAFGAGWFKRMGMSDDQIKSEVEKALTYGGRSALERSVGTIFYPFSFEKTLYKNLGQYLLDRPGQRLMTLAAIDTYQQLDKMYGINDWAKAHLPLLHELQKVNAFSHGVGPGQVGGINAPYAGAIWNLFGPQHIKDPAAGFKAWKAAIPLIGELNDMFVGYSGTSGEIHGGDLTQQARITWQAAANGVDDATRSLFNNPRSPWNPQTPALTWQAQQDAGWQLRTNLITKLSAAVDYNYHNPNAPIIFGKNLPHGIAGQKIDHTTIGKLVHIFYPDFDPSKAQAIAVENLNARDNYITGLQSTSPDRAAAYASFAKGADQFRGLISRGAVDDPAMFTTISTVTQDFREYATSLAEQDPGFLKFYNKYFTSTFGPLQEVSF